MFKNLYKASRVFAFLMMVSLLLAQLDSMLGDAVAMLLLTRMFYVTSALYMLSLLSDILRDKSTPKTVMDNLVAGLQPAITITKIFAKLGSGLMKKVKP
ncbi:hypothetical protein HAP94_14455 [Acidithiobacillus ferrivorans]|nr:hypothetical protein [Acidithiobacillus ferrivorans]